eukprot:TRINITY_DN4811_c1_g1_i5.p1 TRINITY_DN4811_c1_g1~~TRINITY_DN4811_c1_g1_i5.p1  ORF type:complete len:414 (+),score=77.89 TRINITY_DN4811_c1_g1_i5:1479-2720(+)
MYEPIDMNYSEAIEYKDNIDDCQDSCRARKGCGFYTYYPSLKLCHHSSPMAVKVKTGNWFQGGPAACNNSGGQGAKILVLQNTMLRMQCMTNNSYEPLMGRGLPGHEADNPIACQMQCEATTWCHTFVYNVLLKLCFMQEEGAKPTGSVALQISGPKMCFNLFVFNMRIHIHSTKHQTEILKKRKSFVLGVLQAGIVHTFSDYYPYDGNLPGKKEELATASDIKMIIENVTSRTPEKDSLLGTSALLRVEMRLSAPKAIYAAQLFKTSNVSDSIQKNCDELLPAISQIDKDLVFSEGTKLWVGEVFNYHIQRIEPDELWDEAMPREGSPPAVIEYGRYFFATAAVTASLAALALTWRQKARCAGEAKVQVPHLRPSEVSASQLFLCRGGECGGDLEEELMLDIEANSAVLVEP